jgi:raffinose/stachyose/melibiose transport system permease protein
MTIAKKSVASVRTRENRLAARRGYRLTRVASRALLAVVLLVLAVFAILPFYMTIAGSLKHNWDLVRSPLGLPPALAWDNYTYVLKAGFARNLLNTLIVNVICLSLIAFMSSLAAFALARLHIPGARTIRIAIVAGLMIPVYAVLFPLFLMLDHWQLTGSYLALVGPYVAFGQPFAVFVLHGYMKSIPYELDESAMLDGASPFQIYAHIIMPLARPGLAAMLIFEALWIWNELPFALVLVRPQAMKTAAVALLQFGTNWVMDWPKVLAAVSLITLPIIAVYLAMSEQFIKGLTAGAVKE